MKGCDMPRRILIANRGEIAVRVTRTCGALGIETVGIASRDDLTSAHTHYVDHYVPLEGDGPAAYLDAPALLRIAAETGADAIHPGYGFLSESAAFAEQCRAAGLVFIGPATSVLQTFGDKSSARRHAEAAGVRVPRASGVVDVSGAEAFFASLGPTASAMAKAVAGGGGRGIRLVGSLEEVAPAMATCSAEAEAAFGDGRVFLEELVADAQHIEVQIVGDQHGGLVDLGERDCSIQRSRQKIVEFAPAPFLSADARNEVIASARRLASSVDFDTVGTFEFLVTDTAAYFLEANPRLQVEHTVTEEVTGIDLVEAQIRLAHGATIADMGLGEARSARGRAVQLRINAEQLRDGVVMPTTGSIERVDLPRGLGVRIESHATPGYRPSPRFDTLIAKVIVHTDGDHRDLLQRAAFALRETAVTGLQTNIGLVQSVLEEIAPTRATTDRLDQLIATLDAFPAAQGLSTRQELPGNRSDAADVPSEHPDETVVRAPMPGVLVEVTVSPGEDVVPGAPLFVLESMKLEHVVTADTAMRVEQMVARVGDSVDETSVVVLVTRGEHPGVMTSAVTEADLDRPRPELTVIEERRRRGSDAARVEAVNRHRALGHRTARENVVDLFGGHVFREIGSLAVARQEHRRSAEWLLENTTGDGVVAGIGPVNGAAHARPECAALAYDYSVFAGTQGDRGRRKSSRLLDLALRDAMPVVVFAEGGGGRPGDEAADLALLGQSVFQQFAALEGRIPRVGIAAGRCFAGNAALFAMCDVTIATEDASIGMGGPALIQAAGLGQVPADEVGPARVLWERGVVDILAVDEADATEKARQVVGIFQGVTDVWSAADQRGLRHVVPENRLRAYDVRALVAQLVDSDSVIELRGGIARSMFTALVRLEGRPIGVVANNPIVGGGAIDSAAADKLSWFTRLCQARGLPVLYICDTPGFMVGPVSEREGAARRMAAAIAAGAAMTVPTAVLVTRKCYGLGAMAMAGPGREATGGVLAWPTAEFGTMGIEGAVRLAYKKELDAAPTDEERHQLFVRLVDQYYAEGTAAQVATRFHVDEVIDPAATRDWLRLSLFGQA
jgi:acetyl/propionyl-CoA carboxylase alpha subunit/acetyl-CoA carboxylase carboxyltransferase component